VEDAVLDDHLEVDPLEDFGEPQTAPPIEADRIEPTHHNWWVIRDLATDESTLDVVKDEGVLRIHEADLDVRHKALEWYTCRGGDFSSPRGETYAVYGFDRGAWSVRTVTRTVLTADAENFHLWAELDAYEGDRRIFSDNWNLVIPRDHV